MPGHWWDSKEQHVKARDWSDIRNRWLVFVPADEREATARHHLSDLPSLQAEVSGMGDGKSKKVDHVAGLHEGMWLEALWLYRKSANVLAGAQIHIREGMCSWSTSSAYHAAFFAMKAIQHLLGISFPELGRAHLVDLWTPPEQLSKSAIKRGETPIQQILLERLHQRRLEHQPLWAFFQRLLRVTTVACWPPDIVLSLSQLQSDDFARNRNKLHYESFYWPHPGDLVECVFMTEYSSIDIGETWTSRLSASNPKFTLMLGLTVVRMCSLLFQDLAQQSEAAKLHLEGSTRWEKHAANYIYQSAF